MNENYHLIQKIENKPITFLYTVPSYDMVVVNPHNNNIDPMISFTLIKKNNLYYVLNESAQSLNEFVTNHKDITWLLDFEFYEKKESLINLEDILDDERKLQSFFSLMRRKPNKEVLKYFFDNFNDFSEK